LVNTVKPLLVKPLSLPNREMKKGGNLEEKKDKTYPPGLKIPTCEFL
jgi:hypothetical protein